MLVEEVEILPTLPVWISEGIGSTVPRRCFDSDSCPGDALAGILNWKNPVSTR
jgi:hypothetical protein